MESLRKRILDIKDGNEGETTDNHCDELHCEGDLDILRLYDATT